jgi:hypothetical protein
MNVKRLTTKLTDAGQTPSTASGKDKIKAEGHRSKRGAGIRSSSLLGGTVLICNRRQRQRGCDRRRETLALDGADRRPGNARAPCQFRLRPLSRPATRQHWMDRCLCVRHDTVIICYVPVNVNADFTRKKEGRGRFSGQAGIGGLISAAEVRFIAACQRLDR